jgi:Flp pilus assembly protein TadG
MQNMPCKSRWSPFRPMRAQNGSVAVIVAITLTALIGFAGLGTDVVYALNKQRQMQAVASAAAFSGAIAVSTGRNATTEARAVAATAGFRNGTNSVTVTVNSPPLSGGYTGISTAVEVIVAQPQTLPLVNVLVSGSWNVSARAVAVAGASGGGGGCILQLNPHSDNSVGISMSNGINVTMNQCGLYADAGTCDKVHGNYALHMTGGATMTAQSISLVGCAQKDNGGNWSVAPNISQPTVADPYSNVAVPSFSSCNYGTPGSTYTVLGWQNPTLKPGVYCGLDMGNGGSVTLQPGVYIINGGVFHDEGGTSLSGTGVTIVLTGNSTIGYATATIDNGVTVTLSAPTTGTTAGLVFFQDPKAPHTGVDNLAGGANMVVTGALYFPSQTVNYSNGSSSTSTCTQLVAWDINFTGGAKFNSTCGTVGTKTIGGGGPTLLVE